MKCFLSSFRDSGPIIHSQVAGGNNLLCWKEFGFLSLALNSPRFAINLLRYSLGADKSMINDTFFMFSLILPEKLHNLCQVVSRNGERGSDITGDQVDGWIMAVGLTRGYTTVFTSSIATKYSCMTSQFFQL